jgi:acetyltransferase-like isoleucine patch superfamily enzyme
MSDLIQIRVPRLNDNDDTVILVEWLQDEGSYVETGAVLYLLETSKATVEVQAENDGFLRQSVEPGVEVEVQALIGHLAVRADVVVAPVETLPPSSTFRGDAKLTISRKAEVLAHELGVNPKEMSVKGMIREKDVRAFHAQQGAKSPKISEPILSSIPKVATDKPSGEGVLKLEFLEQIRQAPQAFGALPSEFKVWLYRQNGASIGHRVTLGVGTILDAEQVIIGDDTAIENNVLVRCKLFEIGRLGEIAENVKIICGRFIAGDVVGIRFDTVFVGSGTGRTCHIGDNCFVAYDVYVNLDRDVSLGSHVCLSPGVRVYTHRKWNSPLQGFSTGFAPVTIGDNSHLGSGVVVLPGVEIGESVTVMANSVVASNTASEQLIGGIPAQMVGQGKSYRKKLTLADKGSIALKNLQACADSLTLAGIMVSEIHSNQASFSMKLTHKEQICQVLFQVQGIPQYSDIQRTIVVSLDSAILQKVELESASGKITAIDLDGHRIRGVRDGVCDIFRQHLSNLGIELAPKVWRQDKIGPYAAGTYGP